MTHIDKHLNLKKLAELCEHIKANLGVSCINCTVAGRELVLTIRKQDVEDTLQFLRDDKKCQFKMLVDITGVDWSVAKHPDGRTERFDVVYHLLSTLYNQRIRVKLGVNEDDSVPSVTELFSCANWYERETYDMFGIRFEGHPDLRRLLTDYDFQDFPLRKDFPLEGKVEVYYDENEKRVAYKPVDLPQEFRHFDWISPWEGITGNTDLAEEDNVFDAAEFEDDAGDIKDKTTKKSA